MQVKVQVVPPAGSLVAAVTQANDFHASTDPSAISPRQAQRTALQRLIDIASEAPAADRRAETAFEETTRAARRDYARIESTVRSRHDRRREESQTKRDAAVAAADSERQERLERLSREVDAANKTLKTQSTRLERKLKKDLQDAEWLAGITRDANRGRAEQAFEESSAKIASDRAELDQMERDAAEVCRRYRRPFPDASAKESGESLESAHESAESHLRRLRGLLLPKLFAGATPFVLAVVGILAGAVAGHAVTADAGTPLAWPPNWIAVAIGAVVAAAIVVGLGLLLWRVAGGQVVAAATQLRSAIATAQAAATQKERQIAEERDAGLAAAMKTHEQEMNDASRDFLPRIEKATGDRDRLATSTKAKADARREKIEAEHRAGVEAADADLRQAHEAIDAEEAADLAPAKAERDAALAQATAARDGVRTQVDRDWTEAAGLVETLSDHVEPPVTASWSPPESTPPGVQVGRLRVEPTSFYDGEAPRVTPPPAFEVPALLAFPDEANLLLRHDAEGRDAAIAALRAAMVRLLTQLPAGRAQFTLIDPVGLGRSFAGFMHLADYDEALVGGRVLTEQEAIAARLADLTEHMETVIQKYLRNEFETIDAYNAQAGELAEPYRFLVVADLPAGFDEQSLRRLTSIAASGARCGVHVLVAQDVRKTTPGGATYLDDLARHCTTLEWRDDRFIWNDETYGRLPLSLDEVPSEAVMTNLAHKVGVAAREAKRVEVAFDPITPPPGQEWSRDSAEDLHVAVGRSGANRLQTFRLGRGVAQHALVAGKTGSGKSTLLNGLVTNLALWYGPDQLEMYLVDFKRGVEFKAYATRKLPHARAVAVESDREFGLSVLQRLDEELARRGELFRAAGVQDLAGYRKARPGERMPRVLLVIDEFQELFSDDDKLGQDAALLIDRLVRQGRAFGMHVILGSQTVGGAAGLTRATLGQVAVRVALQATEADSRLVLGDNNAAARLLTRPGEAIYNDAGGAVEGNSPFQVAWLPDVERDRLLARIAGKCEDEHIDVPPMTVFEGNAPARPSDNLELAAALRGEPTRRTTAYLGEAVAIKPPTHVAFRRQAGASLLIVGQQEESSAALVASALVSLSATCESPRFLLLDGTPHDAATAGVLRRVAEGTGAEADVIDYRAAGDALADLAAELQDRLDGATPDTRPVFLVIHGLQRFRALARDDSFGMSAPSGGFSSILGDDEADEPPATPRLSPSQALGQLLRDGPQAGMHVVATIDTLASLERRLARDDVREFDNRVLFQMSANDSSTLIDTPAANRLGFYRALLASEERGTQEKFRPYDLEAIVALASPSAATA